MRECATPHTLWMFTLRRGSYSEAVKKLVELLDEEEEEVRRSTAMALGECAVKWSTHPKT
ncbi:MAG: hypothetical protein KIH01_00740 [Candidatus Freyarchaeota archaeon]|nr:hypothetical protein [Candidatus Jordarchaeia archaeon]